MERRNWSIESFNRLKYIDSLDEEEKANLLNLWVDKYLNEDFLKKLDLELNEIKIFSELIYKNILFLDDYKGKIATEIDKIKNMKKFFDN